MQPVARFIPSHVDYKADPENVPLVLSVLLLGESVEPIRDLIDISFLLLERRHRENETVTVNTAQSYATYSQQGVM